MLSETPESSESDVTDNQAKESALPKLEFEAVDQAATAITSGKTHQFGIDHEKTNFPISDQYEVEKDSGRNLKQIGFKSSGAKLLDLYMEEWNPKDSMAQKHHTSENAQGDMTTEKSQSIIDIIVLSDDEDTETQIEGAESLEKSQDAKHSMNIRKNDEKFEVKTNKLILK